METDVPGLRQRNQRNARLLGLFSVALGISELTASDGVARMIGLKPRASTRWTLRALGMREILSGVAILARSDSAGPVWSRVAGDTLDLALLGSSFGEARKDAGRLLAATAAVAGVTAVDAFAAARLSRQASIQKLVQPIHVVRSITINRSPELVYAFWRKLENLPKFMAHLESVSDEGELSRWRATGPAGTSVEWLAKITLDRPNEQLAWCSVEGASVPNRGTVCFKTAPGNRGTEVVVELKYEPPLGALGAAFAKLFGEEPGQQISGDLRRLKQVLETGSVVHSDASIHRGMHPARPPAPDENITVLGQREE
jgi:uncharacterized membrane protein